MAAPSPAAAPFLGHAGDVQVQVTEAARAQSEKEQKEKAVQMLAEARAAEAKKRANRGKKGKKKKKEPEKSNKDAGKSKKPTKTPVQEAWATFLLDMDEKISKLKRVFLEDMYRGVTALDARDQALLSAVLATTNKKVLPTEGLNINQLNIIAALQSASAAAGLSSASAVPSGGNTGLNALRDRGASSEELIRFGYTESDAVRAGYPRHSIISTSQHSLPRLKEAGILPAELITCPHTPDLTSNIVSGVRGVQALREAGYTAHELVVAGLGNPWALHEAGFGLQELRDGAITSVPALQAGGLIGTPPAHFLGHTMKAAMQETRASTIPMLQTGTQSGMWHMLLSPDAAPVAAARPRSTLRR